MKLPVMGKDAEGFDQLTIFDPERCRCFMYCERRAVIDGLCDRCWLEAAAYRNVYLSPEEWR